MSKKMQAISALMKKDIKLLFKDKMAVFFTFIFPLVFAFFFGSIFSSSGTTKGMKVGLTDLDQTVESQAFLAKLKEADEFRVAEYGESEAQELVRKGKLVAYIVMPKGFGENYSSMFSGQSPELLVGIDPARKAEAGYLEGALMKYGVDRFQSIFSNTGDLTAQFDKSLASIENDDSMPTEWKSLLQDYLPKMKTLIEQEDDGSSSGGFSFGGEEGENPMIPLKISKQDIAVKKSGPTNAFSITIPQAVIWAIMGCVIGFAVSIVQEKTLGTMNRLAVAPITRTQILAGKALGCFVTQFLVVAFLLSVAYIFLGVTFDLVKLLLAMCAAGICFVGVMMFFASIAKTERSVAGITNAFLVIMGMIGGAMIPLFVMPGWMQSISHFSPVKWAILSFEGAIWRDFSYAEMLPGLAILTTIGLVAFFIGTRMLSLEEK